MSQRAITLRQQAAEYRRLATTFQSPEMRDQLLALANQCERIAQEIDRSIASGRERAQTMQAPSCDQAG